MMTSHDDYDVGKYLQVDDKGRFFELNFFLFTNSQTFADRKQIQRSPSQHYTHQQPLPNRSTHRLSGGVSLYTAGAAV